MRKLLSILSVLYIGCTYAQAVNWYAYIINNSNKNIYVQYDSNGKWDNWGWSPCKTGWKRDYGNQHMGNMWIHSSYNENNADVILPNSSMLKCGGTTNDPDNGWFAYTLAVKDGNNVIFEQAQSWDVYHNVPANLSIKTTMDGRSPILEEMKINDDNGKKDGVILYVFDDNGFSTTLLNYGDQYSYSNAGYPKSFNLLDKKCKDPKYPNGCTLYQRYDNTISKTAGNFTLTKGQSIAFGNNKAILQDDGNFVIYNNKGKPLIASNTVGSNTDRVIFQGDGNLVAYRGSSPVWASDTVGNPNASLVFRSDGNMTIYNQGGGVVCSTIFSPGVRFCFNKK